MARTPGPHDPDRDALCPTATTTFTYAELRTTGVTRLAHALRARVRRAATGSPTSARNHPSFLETLFAAGTLGAVFVPLNSRLAGPEIALPARDSGADGAGPRPRARGARRRAARGQHLDRRRTAGRRRRRLTPYEELLAAAAPSRSTSRSPPTTPASSCTPRAPPAAPRARCSPTATSPGTPQRPRRHRPRSPTSAPWSLAPLFHIGGLNATVLPVAAEGRLRPGRAPSTRPRRFDLIEQHRVTFMFGVPTMFDADGRGTRAGPDADLSSAAHPRAAAAPRCRPR